MLKHWTLATASSSPLFSWDGTDTMGIGALPSEYLIAGKLASGRTTFSLASYFFYPGHGVADGHSAVRPESALIKVIAVFPRSIGPGGATTFQYTLARTARVRAFLSRSDREPIREIRIEPAARPLVPSANAITIQAVDVAGAALPSGRYRVLLTAFGNNESDARTVDFQVTRGSTNALPGAPLGTGGGKSRAGASAPGSSGSEGLGAAPAEGHGVRDHGVGEGLDGHGQGRGQGSNNGKK